MPETEHQQFYEMTARLGEHEPLPTVVASPAEPTGDQSEEDRTAPLDELILAGLVAPY